MVETCTPSTGVADASGCTVKDALALLFAKAPEGTNSAVSLCRPKKYAAPPGGCVRVAVASPVANRPEVEAEGESVSVWITWPWSRMFTAPDGEPARAGARTDTLNVIGWPSVPALTARLVEV